jgi:hypothetical protein
MQPNDAHAADGDDNDLEMTPTTAASRRRLVRALVATVLAARI